MSMVGALLMLAAIAAPAPTWVEPVWVAQGMFCEPETVLPVPGDRLLVSNVCDYRTAGTGYLTLLAADGEVLAPRLVDGLDAPLGMALRAERLYLVDRNRIRVFDWPELRPQRIVELPSTVANDIVVAADGTLYVTDTAAGHVYVIDGADAVSTLTPEPRFPGANGIAIDGDVLWVGGERLWKVELPTVRQITVGPPWLSDIDGIEVVDARELQVTPVDGPLVQLVDGEVVAVTGVEGAGSANHGYQASTGLVLIPTGFDNRVVAFRRPEVRRHRDRQ